MLFAPFIRYGLPDDKRVAEKIIPAPNSALAVTVDNLARVLLIDTETGMAIRVWKGIDTVAIVESYQHLKKCYVVALIINWTSIIIISYMSLFKGYRDAQCGWIQVFDSSNEQVGNQSSRRGLFLVIYAARRGILEVITQYELKI